MAIAALALASAMLVAACDDDDDEPEPTPTDTATATVTAEPTDTATPEATETEEPADGAVALSVSEDAALGSYLVDAEGRTLYVFTRDTPGVSNCNAGCIDNWPPLTIADGEEPTAGGAGGELGTTERDDGSLQVTYNGAPLYYWINDAAPGDTTGHLVGNVWFVARPDTASTSEVNVQTSGDLAPYLVGPTGMTLYTFANDEPGVSNCVDQCAENWPALTVPEGQAAAAVDAASGEVGVIERADGTFQVTYNGAPLYYWINDALPGDTTGHEVGDVWFVATP